MAHERASGVDVAEVGIKVHAISYDELRALGEFAQPVSRRLESTGDPDLAVAYLLQSVENCNAGPLGPR